MRVLALGPPLGRSRSTAWIMPKLLVALLLCLSLVAHVASAAQARSSGLVVVMDGNDRETLREIYDGIARDLRVEPPDLFSAALTEQGSGGPLGDAVANSRTRRSTIAAVRRALRAIEATAVLSVRAKRKGGARELHVVLVAATQAEPMVEQDVHLSAGEKASAQLVPLLSASLPELVRSGSASSNTSRAVALSSSADKDDLRGTDTDRADEKTPEKSPKRSMRSSEAAEKAAAAEQPSGDRDPSRAEPDRATGGRPSDFSHATVIGHAGLELARRDFQYNDPWAGRLRSHLAPMIAAYSVGAELYPAASTGIDVLKDVGLVGRFADSLGFQTTAADGQTARGGFRRYAVGVRGRIRTSEKSGSPIVGVEATYGMWQVAFTGADQVVDEAPSVAYEHVRAGVDARFPVGTLALFGAAGYMTISSAGRFSERFPQAKVGAVDATIGGTWAVVPAVELRLSVSYARFFSSANPEPGAPYIAGGALDQYVIPGLGAATSFK